MRRVSYSHPITPGAHLPITKSAMNVKKNINITKTNGEMVYCKAGGFTYYL